jgi:protein SCO1
MIRLFTLAAIVAASGLALTVGTASPAPVLPFYDSVELTPRWRPVAHRTAAFDLVTQTGDRLTAGALRGRVHVASFIYTRCAAVCPAMIAQLSKVQTAIAGRSDALLVSYTVTPQQDTPEMLARFAADRSIDSRSWKLVTGDAEQIYALARTSYFADDGRLDAETPAAQQFLHTEKALLVDQDGRIRGVYNATVPHDIDKLIADLELLLR